MASNHNGRLRISIDGQGRVRRQSPAGAWRQHFMNYEAYRQWRLRLVRMVTHPGWLASFIHTVVRRIMGR